MAMSDPRTTSATKPMAHAGRNPSFNPDAATISGEGVSPAAIAAASGSPPGSATANCATDPGRERGSRSMHRRIRRSTTGSTPSLISDGAVGVDPSFCARSSAIVAAVKARLPLLSS